MASFAGVLFNNAERARRSWVAFRVNQWRLRVEARRGSPTGAIRAVPNIQERVVALTYDDGPSPENTLELMDILTEVGARATFFVVGTEVDRYPDIVARLASAGHEVANHSYSHLHPGDMDDETLRLQIARGAATIAAVAERPQLFRPPFGKPWKAAARVCADLGFTSVLWSIDSGDTKTTSAERIAREVVNRVEPGDIVLLHDGAPRDGGPRRQHTLDASRIIIDELAKRGYRFVTVSELLDQSDAPRGA